MSEANPIYFKQLLSGIDLGVSNPSARSMANFVYLIGNTETRECMVVDPAWDIDGLLKVVEEDDMKLTGALVTHYHPNIPKKIIVRDFWNRNYGAGRNDEQAPCARLCQ